MFDLHWVQGLGSSLASPLVLVTGILAGRKLAGGMEGAGWLRSCHVTVLVRHWLAAVLRIRHRWLQVHWLDRSMTDW